MEKTLLGSIHGAVKYAGDFAYMRLMEERFRARLNHKKLHLPGVSATPALKFTNELFLRQETPLMAQYLEPAREILYHFYLMLLALAKWKLESSRAYHLDPAITEHFLNSSSPNKLWGELAFPMRAFMVTLEAPLQTDQDCLFDTILWARLSADDMELAFSDRTTKDTDLLELLRGIYSDGAIYLAGFSAALEFYASISQQKMSELERLLRKRNLSSKKASFESLLSAHQAWLKRSVMSWVFPWKILRHHGVGTPIQQLEAGREKLVIEVKRMRNDLAEPDPSTVLKTKKRRTSDFREVFLDIVSKVALLLMSNRPDAHPKTTRQYNPNPRTQMRSIANPDEVFMLSELIPHYPYLIKANDPRRWGHEKSNHKRGEYHRRKPGKGNDPTAPKEVKVSETEVNKHKRAAGDLMIAQRTVFKF